MLNVETNDVFNEISRLASVKLAPKCTTNQADKLLQRGLATFDKLRKLLNEATETDNPDNPENPP